MACESLTTYSPPSVRHVLPDAPCGDSIYAPRTLLNMHTARSDIYLAVCQCRNTSMYSCETSDAINLLF